MKKVLVFDVNGDYIEDKIVEDDYEPKENEFICEIDTVISFYKPKLINGQVVEGLTQEEIDALKNAPTEPTPLQLLQQENASIILDDLEKEYRIKQLESFQASLILTLIEKGVI